MIVIWVPARERVQFNRFPLPIGIILYLSHIILEEILGKQICANTHFIPPFHSGQFQTFKFIRILPPCVSKESRYLYIICKSCSDAVPEYLKKLSSNMRYSFIGECLLCLQNSNLGYCVVAASTKRRLLAYLYYIQYTYVVYNMMHTPICTYIHTYMVV